MISAEPEPPMETLIARLTTKAKAIAEARALRIALTRRNDPQRWRKAGFIWPLFGRR